VIPVYVIVYAAAESGCALLALGGDRGLQTREERPVAEKWRQYESLIIFDPEGGTEATEELIQRTRDFVTEGSGRILKTERWGVRDLAFEMKSRRKGYYLLLEYAGLPGVATELDRRLNLIDAVVKYQTIKIKEQVDPESLPEPEEFVPVGTEGETTEPAAEAGEPAVEAKEPAVEAKEPAVEAGEPAVEAGEPAVEAKEPAPKDAPAPEAAVPEDAPALDATEPEEADDSSARDETDEETETKKE
jgi:small subunit ribosomal protein S6